MLCITSFSSFAQGEIDTEQKLLYRNENSWSAGIYSNGLGAGFRHGIHKDRLHRSIFDFQLSSIHHPKEIKISSGNGRMVYGKLNSVYALMASYGIQTEKYSKLDKGSVAISFIHDAGISLAFEKPIYYYIDMNSDKIERFNTSSHTKYDKAPFVYGLNETTCVPGLFIKSGVQFEYSNFDREIHAVDVGVFLQTYMKKLQIMYVNDNAWIYPGFYIFYRFGKISSN